jgi:spore maturation protein CgeB
MRKNPLLPFASEPTVHKRLSPPSEENSNSNLVVVFVGTYIRRRGRLIEALEKAGIKVKVYGPYWRYFKRGSNVHDGIYGPDMVKVFNSAKIVLNIHVEDDLPYKLNMRVFEAAGCGAFLLSDKPYSLEKHFNIGSEIVVYNNEDELVKAAKYYLNNSEEREAIGLRAQIRAYKEHTYEGRMKSLLDAIS